MVNKETHTRFWVTLEKPVFAHLSMEAEAHNLSVAAYAGQILTEHLKGDGNVDSELSPIRLSQIIVAALEGIEAGKPFTVKGCFEESTWKAMSRSEKGVAAKILAAIERSSDTLSKTILNKTSIYIKKA